MAAPLDKGDGPPRTVGEPRCAGSAQPSLPTTASGVSLSADAQHPLAQAQGVGEFLPFFGPSERRKLLLRRKLRVLNKGAVPCSTQTRKRPLAPSEKKEDLHTLPWISKALSHIQSADGLITGRKDFESSNAPSTCLPYLRKLRSAAMTLFTHADDAMLDAQTKHYDIQQQIHQEKLSALSTELACSKEQSQVELKKQNALIQFKQVALLKERAKSQKQSTLFSKEKEALASSYRSERDALIDQHTHEQKTLQRQLEEEREKSFCCICLDKRRDTIILPCLHFQYCFSCLLHHREANSNTCPSCRGPIQGLSMSSYLAAQ